MSPRYFSLDEANGYLPWLESLFQRMEQAQEKVTRCQENLAGAVRKARGNGSSSAEREIGSLQKEMEQHTREAQHLLAEVTGKGIVARDASRGLVDFPHLRDGREVYLCWLRGEDMIRFWHDTDVGFAGRQPL